MSEKKDINTKDINVPYYSKAILIRVNAAACLSILL